MKELFIIRHAKSDWSIEGLGDIDRPLNARGYTDAHSIGKYLKQKGVKLQLMVSSPAIRALTTALIISDELSFPKSIIRIEPTLYESGVNHYLSILKSLPQEINSVAIFGHNPIVSDLSGILSGQIFDMPTCAVAWFSITNENWSSISKENIKLIEMMTPKSINPT